MFHVDFETRSRAALAEIGVTKYAKDPSTEVLCMAYQSDRGPMHLYKPGDELPSIALGLKPDQRGSAETIHAHNASFERKMLKYLLGVDLPPSRFRCSAAQCTQSGMPRGLDKSASLLGLSAQKDKAGGDLMKKMVVPDRKGNYLCDDESLARLYDYCKQDVVVERELTSKLPTINPSMQSAWETHELMNDRGIPIDRPLCEGAQRILEDAIDDMEGMISDLTEGKIRTGGQVAKILDYVNQRGVNIGDLREDSIREVLPEVEDKNALLLLTLRQSSAGAAPKKYKKILDYAGPDERIRDSYVFPGAHTGRAASWGVQVMNFKKGGDVSEELVNDISSGHYGHMKDKYPGRNIVGMLGNSVRAAVKASPGKVFVYSDFSQIEMRIVHWLTFNNQMIRLFKGGGDPYVEFAASMFQTQEVSKAQRQSAKPVCLGGNYGMGAARLAGYAKTFGLNMDVSEAEEMIKAYREKYNLIPKLWKCLEQAAVGCLADSKNRRVGRVTFGIQDKWMYVELPSLRRLWYFQPELVMGKFGPVFAYTDNRGVGTRTWGGTLTENLAQAITADLTNWTLVEAEEAGLSPIINQHDEVVLEVDENQAEEAGKALAEIMERGPEWADSLPIGAEWGTSTRWTK